MPQTVDDFFGESSTAVLDSPKKPTVDDFFDKPEATWSDVPGEAVKSIGRGAGMTLGSQIEGAGQIIEDVPGILGSLAQLSPTTRRLSAAIDPEVKEFAEKTYQLMTESKAAALKTGGQAVQGASEKIFPPTPGMENSITRQLGEAVGSGVAGIGPALVGGVPAMVAGGAASGYSTTYKEAKRLAKEAGKSDEEAEKEARMFARISALVTGITEPLGPDRATLNMLGRANKATAGWLLKTIGQSTGENIIQETIQAVPDEGARRFYDKDRPLWDSLVELGKAGALGGAVGGLLGGVAGIVTVAASRGRPLEASRANAGSQSLESVPMTADELSQVISETPGATVVTAQDRALLADHESRVEAGQTDPIPNAKAFDEAGYGKPTRKERAGIIETLKEKVSAQSQSEGRQDEASVEARQAQKASEAQGPPVLERSPDLGTAPTPVDQVPAMPPSEAGASRNTTSIKNAVVDEERQKRGLRPAMEPAKRSFGTVWEEAMQAVESQPLRQEALIAELKKNGRAVTDLEDALLLHRQVVLQNDYDQVLAQLDTADEISRPSLEAQEDLLSNQLLELYDINKAVGTATGRGLAARKMLAAEDFTLARMIAQKRKAKGVTELSATDTAAMKEAQRNIADLQKKLDEYTDRIETLEAEKAANTAVEATKAKVVKERPSRTSAARKDVDVAWKDFEAKYTGSLFSNPVPVVVDLTKIARAYVRLGMAKAGDFIAEVTKRIGTERAGKLTKEINEAWSAAVQQERPQPRGKLEEAPEISKFVRELSEFFVAQGIEEREALVDAVHAELQKVLPGITRRTTMDAISGYGQFTQLSKDEIKVKLRELKGEMQQVAKLEDMAGGKAPSKTGQERRTPSDEERNLIKLVNEAKKKGGFAVTDPATQLRSALDAIKTRLRNQIKDLETQIESRAKLVKERRPTPGDAETKALRDRVESLGEQYDAIFGKPQQTEEQRLKLATAAVERSIADYRKRIAKKDIGPRPRMHGPAPEQLQLLRNERDALRADLKHLRDLANPKMTPEERANSAYAANLARRIADYQKRLAEGDFAARKRPERKLPPEIEKARFALEEAKADFIRGLIADKKARRTKARKVIEGGREVVRTSRAIMTSADFSAVMRQGGWVVYGHPTELARMKEMFQSFRSPEAMSRIENEIANRENSARYKRDGLALTGIHGRLQDMEEAYMSEWAKNIPVVAGSERAYVTFLNLIRADLYDSMIASLGRGGTVSEADGKLIANYVNVATGRGNIGIAQKVGVGLADVFFSPRYVASRFQLLLGQPFMKEGSWRAKKLIATEYARSLAGVGLFYGSMAVLLTAAIGPPGEDKKWNIQLDPRSSDFGKIRIGQTRIDPMAGLAQVTTLLSRVVSGKTKKLSGQVVPIRGKKVPFGGDTTTDVLARFARTKLAPIPSTAINVLEGENVIGEEVTPWTTFRDLVFPLSLRDIKDTMVEQGIPTGTAINLLNIFGMAVQTYEEQNRKPALRIGA